jgi:hypothetical protein
LRNLFEIFGVMHLNLVSLIAFRHEILYYIHTLQLRLKMQIVLLRYYYKDVGLMALGNSGHKYTIVADEIRNAINSGKIAPGSRLETEEALSVRFGVSRQTVRHAISILADEGPELADTATINAGTTTISNINLFIFFPLCFLILHG